MPLIIHSGAAASDLGTSGTKRDDISDVLLASLYFENTLLGLITVGEEFGDSQGGARWTEDALNQFQVTIVDALGASTAGTQQTLSSSSVSTSDANVLEPGYLLQEDLNVGYSVGAHPNNGEILQVITVNGQQITIQRGYGLTAGTVTNAHSASQLFRVINSPTYENSDLGRDKSRARLPKQNLINRWEFNVNISSEQIERTRAGYAPGVADELSYQFTQRLLEKKREMQQALLFSVLGSGLAGQDYTTMGGLIPWLNGTQNSTTYVNDTNELLSYGVTNAMVKQIFRIGGFSNVVIGGPNVVEILGQLFSGQIRLDQNDRNRGFYAQYITPSMAQEHRIINEQYLPDADDKAMMIVGDLARMRLRPYKNSFFYTITAPSFRDGDAARALSKWTFEIRNTGSDVGQSHILHRFLALS